MRKKTGRLVIAIHPTRRPGRRSAILRSSPPRRHKFRLTSMAKYIEYHSKKLDLCESSRFQRENTSF
jgi:hypothetical protein